MARVKNVEPLTKEETFEATANAYLLAKAEADRAAKRVNSLRNVLGPLMQSHGESVDGGHFRYQFSNPIGDFGGLKWERRVSNTLDEEKALEILAERGVLEQATKTITVIDDEAVFALLADGDLSEADIDAMFPAKVTWALKTEKTK